MSLDEPPGHAALRSSPPQPPSTVTAIMPESRPAPPRPWWSDPRARHRLLKRYRTQVASATSTVCATLAVVSWFYFYFYFYF
jgi:hypothetical protein